MLHGTPETSRGNVNFSNTILSHDKHFCISEVTDIESFVVVVDLLTISNNMTVLFSIPLMISLVFSFHRRNNQHIIQRNGMIYTQYIYQHQELIYQFYQNMTKNNISIKISFIKWEYIENKQNRHAFTYVGCDTNELFLM